MLIQKTTHIERVKNTGTMDQLLFSFFDTSILGFKRALSEDGVFLGRNKMKFLSRLNSKFNELKEEEICGINIHSGFCLDQMPGCEVLEVRYAIVHDLLDENGKFTSEPNTRKRDGEIVARFAFRLVDGSVIAIKPCRVFMTTNKLTNKNNDVNPN